MPSDEEARYDNASRLRAVILNGIHGSISVTKAATMLDAGRVNLSRVLNGNADLSIELAKKIEYIFQHDGLELLKMQLTDKYNKGK